MHRIKRPVPAKKHKFFPYRDKKTQIFPLSGQNRRTTISSYNMQDNSCKLQHSKSHKPDAFEEEYCWWSRKTFPRLGSKYVSLLTITIRIKKSLLVHSLSLQCLIPGIKRDTPPVHPSLDRKVSSDTEVDEFLVMMEQEIGSVVHSWKFAIDWLRLLIIK